MKAKNNLSFIEVDLNALINNYHSICKYSGNQQVGAVIKGNAYGNGRKQVFDALFSASCRDFFVADWQEAIYLNRQNARFYALSGVAENEQTMAANFGIIPVFYRMEEILCWSKLFGKSKECCIHLETGLNRLGLTAEQISEAQKLVKIKFLLNHFACGYDTDSPLNQRQFKIALAASKENQLPISMGGSCLLNFDQTFNRESIIIRTGRYLYGIRSGLKETSAIFNKINPIAKLFSPLIAKKTVQEGESVGYDYSYIAKSTANIGVLNIGYSSGCILQPDKAKVFAENRFFEVISQSMDYTMIDLSRFDPPEGTIFEIFGDNIEQYNHGIKMIMMPSKTIQYNYIFSAAYDLSQAKSF